MGQWIRKIFILAGSLALLLLISKMLIGKIYIGKTQNPNRKKTRWCGIGNRIHFSITSGFFSITFFTYYHIVLSIVDSMLTFPSKLLLANSPKDTVDFGRLHEEIREHELKLYQVRVVSVDHALCFVYHVHSSTTTKFSRSTHGSTTK